MFINVLKKFSPILLMILGGFVMMLGADINNSGYTSIYEAIADNIHNGWVIVGLIMTLIGLSLILFLIISAIINFKK